MWSTTYARSAINSQRSWTQPVVGTGFVVSFPDPPPELAAAGGNWTCPPVGQKDHMETIVSTRGMVGVVSLISLLVLVGDVVLGANLNGEQRAYIGSILQRRRDLS